MLAKLIVGIAGLLVLGAGGFLYYESLDQTGSNKRSCCHSQSPTPTSVQPSCSVKEIQTSQTSADPLETLAVMPRVVEE